LFIISIIIMLIPLLLSIIFSIENLSSATNNDRKKKNLEEAAELAAYLRTLPEEEITGELKKRKAALDYTLSHNELSGNEPAEDERGLLQVNQQTGMPIVALKKKALPRPNIDPELSRLILWFLGCATFWLLFGTTIGEYIGIK